MRDMPLKVSDRSRLRPIAGHSAMNDGRRAVDREADDVDRIDIIVVVITSMLVVRMLPPRPQQEMESAHEDFHRAC